MGATVAESAAADRLLTEEVGLVDRSERGKLALTGPQAKELLSGQVTNDIEALTPGQRLLRRAADQQGQDARPTCACSTPATSCWLDTERVALQALFDTLRRGAVGWDASCTSARSSRRCCRSSGPTPRRPRAAELGPEHANRRAQLGGADVLLVATDLGVDVVCAAEDAERVRARARRRRRCPRPRPRSCASSPGARATASTSTTPTIPQEAGLNERAVSFTKGCYVGQETVARLHYRGKPNRHLRGLRLSAPVPTGTPLRARRARGRARGLERGRPRASGRSGWRIVRREAAVGDELGAGDARAVVAELPF